MTRYLFIQIHICMHTYIIIQSIPKIKLFAFSIMKVKHFQQRVNISITKSYFVSKIQFGKEKKTTLV